MSDQMMTRAEVDEAISARLGSVANRSITIKLEGEVFTGRSVGDLLDRLNDELGIDGMKLTTVYTGWGGPGGALDKDDDAE